MDVDGTLTDGGIYLSANGDEFKRFDIQDGMGIALFRKKGGKVALISGRYSIATEKRALELNVDYLVNGTADKLTSLKKIANKLTKMLNSLSVFIFIAFPRVPILHIRTSSFSGLHLSVIALCSSEEIKRVLEKSKYPLEISLTDKNGMPAST